MRVRWGLLGVVPFLYDGGGRDLFGESGFVALTIVHETAHTVGSCRQLRGLLRGTVSFWCRLGLVELRMLSLGFLERRVFGIATFLLRLDSMMRLSA